MEKHKPHKPLVGVTGPDFLSGWGLNIGMLVLWLFTILSLWVAGARVKLLRPSHPHFAAHLDALVIMGGGDVDPILYGRTRKMGYRYDSARDELELRWIARALTRKIPLMGICRGAQIVNVALGGTLYMDIKLVCDTARYPGGILSKIMARKNVDLQPGSRMAQIFGAERLRVNSLHRQSLDAVGAALRITGWEENGIVQAVESDPEQKGGDHFVVGVQWHPELMIHSAQQRRIFTALIAATKRTS